MAGDIYKKPILFAIAATAVILVGTGVTMFYPMLTEQMHPRLEKLKPYTALELAGKDIYQREGCVGCHTQTVRPLKAEVMRYGEYSKAGEFAYDRPFLWGSKRTGPDLARIGGKYPDAWHHQHFESPRDFFPKSNMPEYGWLKDGSLDPEDIKGHMDANGFPYAEEEISALAGNSELDALVAYMQVIGTAVREELAPLAEAEAMEAVSAINPLAGDPGAIALGDQLYETNCGMCHGDELTGGIGPSLIDEAFLGGQGDLADGYYFAVIGSGTQPGQVIEGRKAQGGMPPWAAALSTDQIWSLISYIRSEKSDKD